MTTNSEWPLVRISVGVGRSTDGHGAGNLPIADTAGALGGAIALIDTKIAKAIQEAAEHRQRAAVLIIRFAPRCGCNGAAPCWDLGLSGLLATCGKLAGEWGPLRLDETTLVMVAQGFEDSAYIQRRAAAMLDSLNQGWCIAGQAVRLNCAIGIGLFPEDGDCASILLQRADEALHDLRAVGQSAAGFNLRRTLPTERPTSSRSAPRAWHRAAGRADRDEGSIAAYERKAPAGFELALPTESAPEAPNRLHTACPP